MNATQRIRHAAAEPTGVAQRPKPTGVAQRPSAQRHSIDELLAAARARLDRVAPEDLLAEQASGALVVDIRPLEQRLLDGSLPGAVVIDRNILEWRLDPASDHRIPAIAGYDTRVVVVCNEGYSSSLAAALLHDIGLRRATDLIGGFQAWLAVEGVERHPPA